MTFQHLYFRGMDFRVGVRIARFSVCPIWRTIASDFLMEHKFAPGVCKNPAIPFKFTKVFRNRHKMQSFITFFFNFQSNCKGFQWLRWILFQITGINRESFWNHYIPRWRYSPIGRQRVQQNKSWISIASRFFLEKAQRC